MPPLLSTLLRISSKGGSVSDNFNRTLTGSLGSTSTGSMPWSILTGVWDVNGTRPTTATSPGSKPLAVVNVGSTDIDMTMALGAMDALYFRVQDASNWFRAVWTGWQSSSCSTCCDTCCSQCCQDCWPNWYGCYNSSNGQWGANSACGQCPNCVTAGYNCRGDGSDCFKSCCSYVSCNCVSCNCYTCNCSYWDNYQMVVQRSVAGSVTTIATGSTVSSPATVTGRVVLNQGLITVYHDATQVMSSSAYTDFATATKHGFGRGDYNSYNSSALDNFAITWK